MIAIETTLDFYSSARSASRVEEVGYIRFINWCESAQVAHLITRYRAGDADAKKQLPAVTFMGKTTTGKRAAADMVPTGFVMLDIDHADGKLPDLLEVVMGMEFRNAWNPALIHITPSGKGLRIVVPAPADEPFDIVRIQEAVVESFHLDTYGQFDGACKDLSRLSFLPMRDDIKYISESLFLKQHHATDTTTKNTPERGDDSNENGEGSRGVINQQTTASNGSRPQPQTVGALAEGTGPGRDGESAEHGGGTSRRDFQYGDTTVREIAEAYVRWKGEPLEGSRHNFYNGMVLDFRSICNNDPNILIDVLPLLGADRAERLSQCQGLCKRNNNAKIPKDFYYWLMNSGYYVDPRQKADDDEESEKADDYAAERALLERMPTLPPVFREYVNAAPEEFKIPTLFALLPVMGTLATYLTAEYFDGTKVTPSFMSIISAPPSSGKSFINRFLEFDPDKSTTANLVHELLMRDVVANARYDLWLSFARTKADNDKGKKEPKTSKRLMEAITSQADMLPVMKAAQGMHMLMVVPEIDTLIKGMKSGGGGDKNDIFRIAWDNGTYGQSYRSSISFRGRVALYLNLLATGTPAQCDRLFRDIENGLITRCCFTDCGNQEFASYQPWKKLSKKDLQVIENFRTRCDGRTYEEPMNFDIGDLDEYTDEESFDNAVPWQFTFRGRQSVNLDYINKALLKWLDAKLLLAKKDGNHCMDMWRKRSARKAFNLALLCYACWNKVSKREEAIIKDFALWFADLDLMKGCKHWAQKYNDFYDKQREGKTANGYQYASIYDALPDAFTPGDVRIASNKQGLRSDPRLIIHKWKKAGIVEKTAEGFKKIPTK